MSQWRSAHAVRHAASPVGGNVGRASSSRPTSCAAFFICAVAALNR
jgi:hypothetical protein